MSALLQSTLIATLALAAAAGSLNQEVQGASGRKLSESGSWNSPYSSGTYDGDGGSWSGPYSSGSWGDGDNHDSDNHDNHDNHRNADQALHAAGNLIGNSGKSGRKLSEAGSWNSPYSSGSWNSDGEGSWSGPYSSGSWGDGDDHSNHDNYDDDHDNQEDADQAIHTADNLLGNLGAIGRKLKAGSWSGPYSSGTYGSNGGSWNSPYSSGSWGNGGTTNDKNAQVTQKYTIKSG